MTASYRAVFCDLRTDQVLDALPISGVSMEDFIGKTGTMTGTLTATDTATADRIKATAIPGRTAVWIERDRELWWGGILWTTKVTSAQRATPAAAEIQAATFDSYLDHRLITTNLRFDGADQFAIARRLITYAQEPEGADIGIRPGPTTPSGVERDRTYSRFDLPRIRDTLDKLAAVRNGFEWRIQVYRDALGERVKELQLGHPRITTTTRGAEIVLGYPGPVLTYAFPYDATDRATHWQSRGATDEDTQRPLLSALHQIDGATDAGWPRLDGTSDHTTVTSRSVLDDHAEANLTEAWRREVVPEITVNLDAAQLTPAVLGAHIRLRIADVWTAAGFTGRYRVVGFTVRAPERAQPETATLHLDATSSSQTPSAREARRTWP